MRKILLFILPLLFSVIISNAQYNNAEDNTAMQLVSANKSSIGLLADDLNNVKVSNTYIVDNVSGIRMVYLVQTHQGIPVFNQMLVLAFKNGKLVSNQGAFNRSVPKLANVENGIPSVSAESAVQSALSDRGLQATQMAIALNRKDNGQKIEFGNMGVSLANITAHLMWVPVEENVNNIIKVTKVQLAWQVFIYPKTTSDCWLVRVDASNNSILGMTNLTDYDNWGDPVAANNSLNYPAFLYGNLQSAAADKALFDFKQVTEDPNLITTATYRVIPFPAEAPSFPLGAHALRTDPWLAAPGNATTLKWHTGLGGVDYAYSRGNNVWAYEDRTAPLNTGTQAKSANSTTPVPNLTFDFTPDYTQPPTQTSPVPNQQFNITNLFYWNNLVHDVMYIYGWNEASANFQDDNLGRGGLGNDHVNAEAQDIGGTNNANFATPPDGTSGRMQMYLWTLSTPQRDGDVDNGVVVHEFGHGISNRFTGGGTTGCLGNAEQMGEGWSDWYGLMFTQDWATATLNTGFNSPRGIGTYVLNQPPSGVGIRSQRYCTDFTINNKVYAASIPAAPHDRGEIWCATIWDMTWNIINQVGTINPNLYNLAGGGGNNIALKLVTEGLRLQQCSPGFISGRNAILAADQALYGGLYNCAIREAFRRRGMGDLASEGSTNSVTDQVTDFTPLGPSFISATPSVTTVPEGQPITYTNTIAACAAVSGYTLRDTLPTNVTYVSGGTYDPPTRVVSFPVNQGAGSTNYIFTVNVNAGSYFPPVTLINETVAGATIPASWTTTAPLGTIWTVSTTVSNSAPNSFYVENLPLDGDQRLETTSSYAIPLNSFPQLSFWHRFNTEPGWDGGVVEISTDGGASWTDLGSQMTLNGYNGGMGVSPNNPLGGRAAFTGLQGTFINTKINLAPYGGQSVKIRFRFGSDNNTTAPTLPAGWWVDDIVLDYAAAVNMRTSLFNASNARISFKDMVTLITQFVACAPIINTQPTSVTVCQATSTSFTCVGAATGGVTYQWQLSTAGAGGPWNPLTNVPPYSGVTTSTLTINPTAIGMNGYMYRCVVTGSCAPNATSNAATLNVLAASIGGTVTPANTSVCGTTNSGTLTLSGHVGSVIRWESAVAPFVTYTPIANTTTTLTFNNITQTTNYRAVVQVTGCVETTSSVATVTFTASLPIAIVATPGSTLCQGDPALLTVVEGTPLTNYCFTQSTSATITPLNSVACAAGGFTTDNSYWRVYPLAPYALPGPLTITSVRFGIEILTNVTLTARIYVQTGAAFPGGVRTLIRTQVITLPNQTLTTVTVPVTPIVVNPTDVIVIELFSAGVAGVSRFWIGSNAAAETGVSYLSAVPCGIPNPTDLAVIGFPNMNILLDFCGTTGGATTPVTTGTFSWSPAAGLNQTTGNPVAASPAVTTTYTVLHNNGAGCIRQANITITVNTRPAVTAQPANITVCNTTTATFTVGATATGITYQWEVSTNGGLSYTPLVNAAPYSGVNTATLTINPVTLAMNNNRYRCAISGTCPPTAFSNGAILTVNALPVVTVTPASPVCGGLPGINGTALTASGANSYVWTPNGIGSGLYTNAGATIVYTGTNLATVYAAPNGVNTIYTVTGTNATTLCSNTATIGVVFTPPAPTVTPTSVTMCLGDAAVKLKSASSQSFSSTFTSGTVNITIPDGPGLPPVPPSYPATTSNITVSGIPAGATIANIRARFNITHNWVADLIIVLKAPNGNVFNLDALLSGTNNAGANFTNTVISSAGVNALSTGAAPWTNTYRADAAGATFTALGFTFPGGPAGYIPNVPNWNGLYSVPNGTWTIAIYDAGAPDAGVLNNWSMDIDYIVGVVTSAATWSPAAGLFSDAAATVPYVAGTQVDSVWTRPTPSGVYNYQATVNSAGFDGFLSFSNPAPITIPSVGIGNPYPSNIVVSGLPATSASVENVILRNMSHTWGDDIDILLQSPTGQNVVLMSDVGGTVAVPNATYTFNDAGPLMAFGTANPTGTYHPTNNGAADTWVAPGPGAITQAAPALSMFGNTANVNGTWKLFVVDDVGGDQGTIANGWTITFKYPTAGCTSPARNIVVTVNQPLTVTSQPAAQTICTDKVATFSVAVAGSGPFTYQWQVSTDGGNTYNPVANGGVYSGATTANLTITAPPVTMSGYVYRCSIQGALPCAPILSFFRILTVNPLPTIVIGVPPYVVSLFPGMTTTLNSTVSPFAASTYTWLRNGVPVSGANTGILNVNVDALGTYQLRVTDVNNCTNISNTVIVKDSASGKCFIYPNPNSGKFEVRYYSVANNVLLPRSLTVYDSKGDRVLTQKYSIGRPYDRMEVDMRRNGKGLYWVEIGDVNGNRLTMCRIVIQ